MKKIFKILSITLLICFLSVGLLIGCDGDTDKGNPVEWFAPMLAFDIHTDKCSQDTHIMKTHTALTVDNTGRVTTADVTASTNLGTNAVRATARFDYRGEQEFNARFRVAVSRIDWRPTSITRANASIVAGITFEAGANLSIIAGNFDPTSAAYLDGATNARAWYFNRPDFNADNDVRNTRAVEIPAENLGLTIYDWAHPNFLIGHNMPSVANNADVFVLMEGAHQGDPALWNIRQANFGGPNTGGIADVAAGIPATFLINKDTADNFAEQDFYIVGLTTGRYMISYFMTIPDYAGHWHNFDIIAHTSTIITVSDTNSPWLSA